MNLLDMRDRLLALPTLEDRMVLLESEIQEAEKDLSKLRNRYKRENRNIGRLERESFSTLLIRLTGRLETRLEETKLDEINAKLAYDNAAAHLSNLTQERQELASRIAPLKAEEKTFSAELHRRRKQITRQLTEPLGIRYTELENERSVLIPQITKLKEALRVATNALSTAEKVAVSLGDGTQLNSIGPMRIQFVAPRFENVEQNLHTLFSQMRELMMELRDVQDIQTLGLTDILSTPPNIEFTFSSAYSMRIQIRNRTQEVIQILDILRNFEAELSSNLNELQDKYTANRHEEEELLFSIS